MYGGETTAKSFFHAVLCRGREYDCALQGHRGRQGQSWKRRGKQGLNTASRSVRSMKTIHHGRRICGGCAVVLIWASWPRIVCLAEGQVRISCDELNCAPTCMQAMETGIRAER